MQAAAPQLLHFLRVSRIPSAKRQCWRGRCRGKSSSQPRSGNPSGTDADGAADLACIPAGSNIICRLGLAAWLEVTEAVLSHINGSRCGIAGASATIGGEKRAALDAWAARVLVIAEQRKPADNVVKLARMG
jgi:hypothetical protein